MPKITTSSDGSLWDSKSGELSSVEGVLNKYIPEKEREEVRRILYGSKAQSLDLPDSAKAIAKRLDFDLVGYKINA